MSAENNFYKPTVLRIYRIFKRQPNHIFGSSTIKKLCNIESTKKTLYYLKTLQQLDILLPVNPTYKIKHYGVSKQSIRPEIYAFKYNRFRGEL